jgi:putative hydrolase of the HAD superfamily
MCTEALGVAPADCVFVDDQSRNVLGAIDLGWQTVQFDVTQPAGSYQRALALLGL